MRILTVLCMLVTLILSSLSCSKPFESSGKATEQESPRPTAVNEVPPDDRTVYEDKYYRVYVENSEYYYCIYDETGEVVDSGSTSSRLPHISLIDDHTVKFTLQTGTGLGTQWGYYYNAERDVRSRIFMCIYDEYGGKTVYGDVERIIVRDIFDKTKYYREISSFKNPLSDSVEPIINANFINNGRSVKVIYLTGKDYQ